MSSRTNPPHVYHIAAWYLRPRTGRQEETMTEKDLVTQITAYLDLDRSGVLVPRTGGIAKDLLERAADALTTLAAEKAAVEKERDEARNTSAKVAAMGDAWVKKAMDLEAERDTLAADNARMREALWDCIAVIRKDLEGPAQVEAVLRRALALVPDYGDANDPEVAALSSPPQERERAMPTPDGDVHEALVTALRFYMRICGNTCGSPPDRQTAQEMYDCGEAALKSVASAPARLMPSLPDGYALVPIQPTEGMIEAGEREFRASDGACAMEPAEECWLAMIKAAPVPSQSMPEPPHPIPPSPPQETGANSPTESPAHD